MADRSSVEVRPATQAGVAPCQTRACPFTRMEWASAKATMASAPEKSK